MVNAQQWHVTGDWFDICSCDIPCPCEFAQAPTNNHCLGVLAWHIREGRYGSVQLDGLNAVAVGGFDGNIWAEKTNAAMGVFLDERGDERQREALGMIFGGQAGGWPAQFAALIADMRGVVFAPITIEVANDLARWQVEIPGKVVGKAEALSGPTTPPGQRVQTINPPGSEVGPGQVATWGSGSVEPMVNVFGFTSSITGKSSKHIPFDWSGPG